MAREDRKGPSEGKGSMSAWELKGARMATPPVSIRLGQDILDRADALIDKVSNFPELAMVTEAKRAHVIRLAVLRGLDALEQETSTKKA